VENKCKAHVLGFFYTSRRPYLSVAVVTHAQLVLPMIPYASKPYVCTICLLS
jgi:hypothetical protein